MVDRSTVLKLEEIDERAGVDESVFYLNSEEISRNSCLRIELLESLKKHCNTAGLVSTTMCSRKNRAVECALISAIPKSNL